MILVTRAQIEIDHLGSFAPTYRCRVSLRDGKRSRDRRCGFVPNEEHVTKRPFEALRPQLKAIGDADDTHAHADLRTRATERAFDDHVDAQIATNFLSLDTLALQIRDGAAGSDLQPRSHRKGVEDVVRETFREIVVLRRAQVAERQHGNGLVPDGRLVQGTCGLRGRYRRRRIRER